MSAGMGLPRRDLLGAGAALVVSFSLAHGHAARADEQGGSPAARSPALLPGSLKEDT